MPKGTQISAFLSGPTRDLLELYVRETGVKKGHLVEEALRHHLQALREIPAEFIIKPRIVVSKRSWKRMLDRARHPKPTRALRDLMASDPGGD